MKFVSKASNLTVTLKAGVPSNYALGTPSIPGRMVRFVDGIVEIEDEEDIKLMRSHPGYNRDFFPVEDEVSFKDPYKDIRGEAEPAHVIQEMDNGRPGKSYGTPLKDKSREKTVELAKEIAKEMVRGLIPDLTEKIREEVKKEMKSEHVPLDEQADEALAESNEGDDEPVSVPSEIKMAEEEPKKTSKKK